MSFDPKCLELAEYFLDGESAALKTDEIKHAVAGHIQHEIEREIEYQRKRLLHPGKSLCEAGNVITSARCKVCGAGPHDTCRG